MSASTGASGPTGPDVTSSSTQRTDTSTGPTITIQQYMQWGAVAFLAVSVLGMEIAGFMPKGTYLSYVVTPGLAFLGVHAVAKNLN